MRKSIKNKKQNDVYETNLSSGFYAVGTFITTIANLLICANGRGTKERIESSKCRLAILDFYKRNNLTSGSNGW